MGGGISVGLRILSYPKVSIKPGETKNDKYVAVIGLVN